MILVHLAAILSLLIVVHGRLSWKQEPFDDNLPFEENFGKLFFIEDHSFTDKEVKSIT